MGNRAPAFQFYPSDYLGRKLIRMSDASQGIYWRLICFMWKDSEDQCSIEKDDKTISKVLSISIQKWEKALGEIQWNDDPILLEENGRYVSKRLRKEKEKQLLRSEKASNSAGKRWHKDAPPKHSERNANASAKQCTSSSVSFSSSGKDINKALEYKDRFSEEYKIFIKDVALLIGFINTIPGKNFAENDNRATTMIKQRIGGGATFEDLLQVIIKKSYDPDFHRNRKWMSPYTLFEEKQFEKYMSESFTDFGADENTTEICPIMMNLNGNTNTPKQSTEKIDIVEIGHADSIPDFLKRDKK